MELDLLVVYPRLVLESGLGRKLFCVYSTCCTLVTHGRWASALATGCRERSDGWTACFDFGVAVCRGRCSASCPLRPFTGVAWPLLAVAEDGFTRCWSLVPRRCELAGTAASAFAVLAEIDGLFTPPSKATQQASKKSWVVFWATCRGRRTLQRQLREEVPVRGVVPASLN